MNENNIELVMKAIEIVRSRLEVAPNYNIFLSIDAQLDYLLSILNGDSKDKTRLEDINIGFYAVHEFEESDPELSQILKEVYYIVYKMLNSNYQPTQL